MTFEEKRIKRRELEDKIAKMYRDNVSFEDMSKETGLAYYTLQKYLGRIRKDGRLPQERRKVLYRKPPKPYHRKPKPIDGNYWAEEGVKCTRSVSSSCIHGTRRGCSYGCNYMYNTGHSRGCPTSDCHRYKRDKNIARKSEFMY